MTNTERYGHADPAEADPATYVPPHGLFLVGHLDDRPVAAGGYRAHAPEPATVEVKKMYAHPNIRGRGFGRLMVAELEIQAIKGGAKRMILETGIRNIGALALYADMGYRPMASYVEDRDPDIDRAFGKDLVDP